MTDLQLLLAGAFVTWSSLMLASVLRSRSWTPEGKKLAFGNREALQLDQIRFRPSPNDVK